MQRQLVRQVQAVLFAATLILFVSPALAGVPGAAVQGIVRDSQGVAQMGALVQVLAINNVATGTAFTDLHGRYIISNLIPGKYRMRATATLFVPAIKADLQLRTGARTVVNLTLATLFETEAWLPGQRRRADETADDWKWTLRSPVNRPILRVLGDEDVNEASVAGIEASHRPTTRAHAVIGGGSGYGVDGNRATIAIDRQMPGGRDLLLQATSGAGSTSGIALGYQRSAGSGTARTMLRYQAHPELGNNGLQIFDIRSAQQTSLGDLLQLEMGGIVQAVHSGSAAWSAQPFLRVTAHPADGWIVQYRIASSREMQEFADVDAESNDLPYAAVANGHLSLEAGLHQEFSVAHGSDSAGSVRVAVYHDALKNVGVSGTGSVSAADGALWDFADGSFRTLANGSRANGASVAVSVPLAAHMLGTVLFATGQALTLDPGTSGTLDNAAAALKPRASRSATGVVGGHMGATRVRATYRWQPGHTVTAVNPYANVGDGAYLGFALRQPVRWAGHLPPGLEASVDVLNLLAQGYRPFLSEDGQTLYFAQTPRTMQAGLAFTF